MYKLVLFDLDGTLADTDLVVIQTMIRFIDRYAPGKKVSLSELLAISGPPIKDTLKRYFPKEDVSMLVKEFADVARDFYPKYAMAFPGAIALLKKLKASNIPVGIVTSKLRRNALITTQEIGIDGLYDLLISLDEVSSPKPHPEGILKALSHFKVSASETVFIGDTLYDYQAGLNANVATALVTWALRDFPKETQPTHWIESYHTAWEVFQHGTSKRV